MYRLCIVCGTYVPHMWRIYPICSVCIAFVAYMLIAYMLMVHTQFGTRKWHGYSIYMV